MTMLEFLAIRRYKVARKLNFNAGASASNPIANFAIADYDYKTLYKKLYGVEASEDDFDRAWWKYYLRIKYKTQESTNLKATGKASKAKAPKNGEKAYIYARGKGQDDLLAKEELDALADEIANML